MSCAISRSKVNNLGAQRHTWMFKLIQSNYRLSLNWPVNYYKNLLNYESRQPSNDPGGLIKTDKIRWWSFFSSCCSSSYCTGDEMWLANWQTVQGVMIKCVVGIISAPFQTNPTQFGLDRAVKNRRLQCLIFWWAQRWFTTVFVWTSPAILPIRL